MKYSGKRYFGTDGIRGTVGEVPITVDFVLKLGWAIGRVLKQQQKNESAVRVVIGKDTRVSGYMLESALEAGLSAAGVDVYLLGPIPTPGIAYLTRELGADAGIVVSASHNPYQDNGIKLFSREGEKISEEMEEAIHAHLGLPIVTLHAQCLGKAYRVTDAAQRYITFCKNQFSQLSLKNIKIVLDCAHGATYAIAPVIFEQMGATVLTLGVTPDGKNINQECGSTDPRALQARVLAEKADLGIAFDGDGDRVIFVDEKGKVVNGDQLLYILACALKKQSKVSEGIVGTQMSNLGLEQAIKQLGYCFERTAVGDKYVHALLKQRDWLLGGESSGHIIQMHRNTTGDGILAALGVLDAILMEQKTVGEILSSLKIYPQVMINVRVSGDMDPILCPEIVQAVAQTEAALKGHGRVLLRRSGTEPLVRVMVEGEDLAVIQGLADELAQVVRQNLICPSLQA